MREGVSALDGCSSGDLGGVPQAVDLNLVLGKNLKVRIDWSELLRLVVERIPKRGGGGGGGGGVRRRKTKGYVSKRRTRDPLRVKSVQLERESENAKNRRRLR